MGDIHIFVDDCSGRYVGTRDNFIGSGAQNLEQRLVETTDFPLFAQIGFDQRVDVCAAAIGADNQIIKKIDIGVD